MYIMPFPDTESDVMADCGHYTRHHTEMALNDSQGDVVPAEGTSIYCGQLRRDVLCCWSAQNAHTEVNDVPREGG
jgi:hypothetical protein